MIHLYLVQLSTATLSGFETEMHPNTNHALLGNEPQCFRMRQSHPPIKNKKVGYSDGHHFGMMWDTDFPAIPPSSEIHSKKEKKIQLF